jgi:hypothetical protein
MVAPMVLKKVASMVRTAASKSDETMAGVSVVAMVA